MALPDRPENVVDVASAAVLCVGVLCFGIASVYLGQDANWDLRNYHIYNGYAFITGRYDRDIAPAQFQSYINPVIDAATYIVLSSTPPKVFGFLLGAVHGLNFWLTYSIAQRILTGFSSAQRVLIGVMCATVGACGAGGLSGVGTLLHDVTTSSFVLVSLLLSLRYYFFTSPSGQAKPALLLASGLALGVGVGAKYTIAVYGIGLAAAIASTRRAWKIDISNLSRWGAAAACGFVLCAGPWMYILQRRFGNPLFPFYNSIFRSPYADFHSFSDVRMLPADLRTHLSYPFLFTVDNSVGMELRFQDLRFASVFLAAGVVLAALAIQRARKSEGLVTPLAAVPGAGRYFFVFFFVSYVVWQKQFGIYRYVQVLEYLAPLVIFLLLSMLISSRRQLPAVAALPFLLILVTLRVPNWGRVPWRAQFIDASVPAIPNPERTTVVMSSSYPTAYVIPAFPRETQFVRIESNFFHPTFANKLAEKIAAALRADRDYYLLTPSNNVGPSAPLLAAYKLERVDGSCGKIASNLEQEPDNPLMFCALRRAAAKSVNTASDGVALRPSGQLTVSPNPVPLCKAGDVSSATVSWKAVGTTAVELRVTSPDGPTWTSGGAEGTARTDAWVSQGTTFYLQDAAHGAPSDPKNTLARVVVNATQGSCQ